jgi:hypothetical protein
MENLHGKESIHWLSLLLTIACHDDSAGSHVAGGGGADGMLFPGSSYVHSRTTKL